MSEKPIRKPRETGTDFREASTGHRSEQKADPAQETAIHHGAGPCAVIAGPGSGKTFVLVERIRYLIDERGIDPSSILVLTFSRAAAAHMRRRFLYSCARTETVFGTFHSVFLRILQESGRQKLRLIDPGAKQSYLQHLCSLKPAPAFLPEKATAEELQLLISRYKNGLPCRQNWLPELVRVYDQYLQGRGWLDFDDMILQCQRLLQENSEILALWQDRFQWILVDEFQDVSPAQYETLQLLAAPRQNIFVVGDDDQSIYGFRGADPLMMRRFLSDYCYDEDQEKEKKAGSIVFLTTNYRCGKEILHAGTALIRCNKHRIDKDFRPGSSVQGSFSCLPFSDRKIQYSYIANALQKMTLKERSQTAVIFRTHGAAAQFLRVLQEQNVAFLAAGTGQKSAPLTDKVRILQDLCAYFRAAVSAGSDTRSTGGRFLPRKELSREDLLRIMNRPERFLSGSFLPYEHMDREQILRHAGFERETIEEFIKDLELLNSLSPSYAMRYLLDSVGYRAYALKTYKKETDYPDELEAEAAGYKSVRQWLLRLEGLLEAEMAETKVSRKDKRADGVRILTMHACKGLEFNSVFIPDLNEGSIPSKRSWTPDEVEEERRLLYVAMTRARMDLTLTYMEGTPDRPAAPSRFLQPFFDRVL